MKKIFNAPELEIMILGEQDVITTSTNQTMSDGSNGFNPETNGTADW